MPQQRLGYLIAAIAMVILGLTALDLAREPVFPPWGEVALDLAEKLILVAGMAVIVWTVNGLTALREAQEAMSAHLARNAAQGDLWRNERKGEIAAMGQAIDAQFRQWGLSPAEIDVAGLLLKGCSMKEIAIARTTSEATIRQQAQTVYQKSGLSGRTELSAFFLDTLFTDLPDAPRDRIRVVP